MISKWKFEEQAQGRCLNIDWLELYCIEDNSRFPVNADYYREHLYSVRERPYGTRQYKEMFVILDEYDQPFLEVRRCPVSGENTRSDVGIFDPLSCHVRLSNRYCYHPQAVDLMSEFLHKHGYIIQHIFRIDLCLDFTKFDSGDDPHKFLVRYLQGKFSKINQGNISSHGKDKWNGREWNSVSWGAPSSMVSTKFYCKSLELQEAKDKPYIRYAWFAAGLVDDFQNLTKKMPDGTIEQQIIYRVEFSIRSKARHWLIVEDNNGRKTKRVAKPHDLGCYRTKEQRLEAFAMLAHHYFHFKHYQEGVRKDRCADKVLFDFALNHTPYVLDRLMAEAPNDAAESALLRKLREYRIVAPDDAARKACDTLISELETSKLRHTMPDYYDRTEAQILQALIAERMGQNPKEPIQQTLDNLAPYFLIQDTIF